MILTAGNRRIEYPINSPQDAIEFAQNYSMDPAALFDLVNARLEGVGSEWVRDALKGCVYSMGNDSHDALIGLLNLIKNSSWITRGPHVNDVPVLDVPAFCVASGPSLASHIDQLREAQYHGLIIAADTAVAGLIANGILPHIACPVERHDQLKNHTVGSAGVTYGGSLFTERAVNDRFGDHIVMPSNECLGKWVDKRTLGYGSSTGTASVALALTLTRGRVYLVGHDISFGSASHWDGSSGPMVDADDTCEGNDGKVHRTNHWFKVFRDQIATMARNNPRICNVNILGQVGAHIPSTLPCFWPDTAGKDEFFWNLESAPVSEYRRHLPWRIALLPGDLGRARELIHRAMTVEQLSCEVICGGDNIHIAESLFRSVYIQFSIEKRLGMSPTGIFLGMRDAMLNILDNSLPLITEVCDG